MRVVTYNILNGAVGREPVIQTILAAINADVIILQEVASRVFIEDLAASLAMSYFMPPAETRWRVAVLTRDSIVSAGVHGSRHLRTVVEVVVRAGAAGARVRMLGLHAAPFPNVMCECWRAWELRLALACAAADPGSYCLIAGDLNAVAPGDTVQMAGWPWYLRAMALVQGNRLPRFAIRQVLNEGFVDCFRACSPGEAGYTVPVPRPNARIDYIFANAALATRLTNCVVVGEPAQLHAASDHYPVAADFAV